MLTKQDLKNIGDLIDTKLEEKLESKLKPIREDIKELKTDVKSLQKDTKTVKREVKTINKNLERDFGFHETQNRYVIKNVQQIQRHLGIHVMAIEAPDINNF